MGLEARFAHFTCKMQGKLISIEGDDLEQAYNTMFWKPTQICIFICHTSTDMAQCLLAERNMWLFWKFSKVDLFLFKTKLHTSLPRKYRNGVVLAFCNLAVFPWWVESSYSSLIMQLYDRLSLKLTYLKVTVLELRQLFSPTSTPTLKFALFCCNHANWPTINKKELWQVQLSSLTFTFVTHPLILLEFDCPVEMEAIQKFSESSQKLINKMVCTMHCIGFAKSHH